MNNYSDDALDRIESQLKRIADALCSKEQERTAEVEIIINEVISSPEVVLAGGVWDRIMAYEDKYDVSFGRR